MDDAEISSELREWFKYWKVDFRPAIASVLGWLRAGWSGTPQTDGQVPEPARRRVLVIGAGGVGKTTFARWLLDAKIVPEAASSRYVESLNPETFLLEVADTESPVEIVVPPGQSERRSLYWTDLEEEIARGDFTGVILVNAFGYHGIGDRSFQSLDAQAKNADEFLQRYLPRKRKDEVEVIKRIAQSIGRCSERLWVLTLVLKEDLWADQRGEAETFYRTGSYGQQVQQLLAAGQNVVQHELVMLSLFPQNLKTGQDELLAKTVAGYDLVQIKNSYERLFQVLAELKAWESTK